MKIKVHTSFVGKTGYNAHSRDFFTALSKIVDIGIRNFTVGDTWEGLREDPHQGEKYLTEYQKSLMIEQTVMNNEGEFYDVEIYNGNKEFEEYDIDLILNETNHHYFYDFSKFKGKFKIAYNVWESTRQPQHFFDCLLKFDQLWVPSEWQKQVSIEQGYPEDKVFVVPEAVESKMFFPDKNKIVLPEYNDNHFKFLLFGRFDYRKSTKEIIQTFLKTFNKSEPVDLICSIENPYSVDSLKTTDERLEAYGLKDSRIKILKFPPREDYINYLKNGHVFLSCARSEGWNLPLIEALACGIPCIYSGWGAQLQFASGKGHPVKIIGERPVGNSETYGLGKPSADETHGNVSESIPGNYCEPDFNDLSKVIRDVYTNYWEYKGRALKDSEKVRTEYSWENAAIKAKSILDDLYNKFEIYDNIEEQRYWNKESSWTKDGHEWSEYFESTDKLWDKIIYPKIQPYLKGEVLEIAPGFGRITDYLIDKVNNLTIVDLNEVCINKCKEKFGDKIKNYYTGKTLSIIEDESKNFVFSWDSFVHMNESVIRSYIYEIYRILKPGGYAFIHHSNLRGGNEKSFENISGRSNMTPDLFKSIVEDASLIINNQEDITSTITDTLTTFYKPNKEIQPVPYERKKPKVSVVTSFYNVENYVDESIISVLNQTFKDFEFIVTDDFSDDSTKKELKKWLNKDKRIKYVEQTEKQEIYWNPHKYANGDIIVIFDADDILLPKALETLVHMFDLHEDVVLIDSNSIHYNGEFNIDKLEKPRYCKKYKYFRNYLSYHKYYIENKGFRFGETWGGLRSFRNILDRDYDFRENYGLKLGKHEDLLRFLKFEELGKILYIGRVLNKVRDRSDSNSNITKELEFKKIWDKIEKRRKTIKISNVTAKLDYEPIWESTYSMYYSDIHDISESKNISLIGTNYSKKEKKLFRNVYFDHNIHFNEVKSDIDYYFINFNTFDDITEKLNNIFLTKHENEISITIQAIINESEPDLITIEKDKFNGKLREYLVKNVNYRWYMYADSYFYATFKYNTQKDKKKDDFVFFTGGDEKYLPIVETCVKSMLKYSEIPIIVYGFNCDVPFDYPNMEKRRIDRNREKKFNDRDTRPYYYKIDASLDCLKHDNSKIYIWLDGDCVVNNNIDSIIKYHYKLLNYPLCMRYKHENLIHRRTTKLSGYRERGHGEELGKLLGVERNNNFTIATGLYMFDLRSKEFFEKVLYHHKDFLSQINAVNCVDDMALAEERLFNVLFWQYNYKNYLPITWISNTYYKFENGNEFPRKIENYIKSGFDVMFDYDGTNPLENNLEDQSKILFYHGVRDISKVEKLLELLDVDKLMIVAHPDDETIFGGGYLIDEEGWKVVVVTDGGGDNNDTEVRHREFKKVMSKLGIKDYELLGFKDNMNNVLYDESEVENKLRDIIYKKKWKKIVTHNEEGEYGHIIHKSVHNIVKNINPDDLYFFKKSNKKLNEVTFKLKNKILDLYESQDTNLRSFRDYKIYEGTTEDSDVEFLEEVKKIHIPNIIFKFNDLKAFVEIKDPKYINNKYKVELKNEDKEIIYGTILNSNNWAETTKQDKQLKWNIRIFNINNDLLFNHNFNLENQNVKFNLNSDYDIAVEQLNNIIKLIKKYKDLSIFIYTPFFIKLKDKYPELNFLKSELDIIKYYAEYNISVDDNIEQIFENLI